MGCFVARMLCCFCGQHMLPYYDGFVRNFLGNLHCQKVVDKQEEEKKYLTIL